jgi:hypothetical protein
MDDTSLRQKQISLFLEWKDECDKLLLLRNIIQNNFELLIRDSRFTKESIENNLKVFKTLFKERVYVPL